MPYQKSAQCVHTPKYVSDVSVEERVDGKEDER